MWPIPTIDDELILVSFSSNNMVCSWIQKRKNNSAPPLILRAYERHDFSNLELINLMLFNPTIVRRRLISFLERYDKKNAFIAFSLDGLGLSERFVAMPTSAPVQDDFGISYSSGAVWDYFYLYPNDHGQFVFYLSMIPRSLLLQYQLLAISFHGNLVAITTKNMALFYVYKNIFDVAFRRTQLALDMARHNNEIEKLISPEIMKRIMKISPDISLSDELSYIATACGLFCYERMN